MTRVEEIQNSLRAKGYRSSKMRVALIKILSENTAPQSAASLMQHLATVGVNVNKTTVYRELTILKNEGHVRELQLGESAKQYEMASAKHHHHLVCLGCQAVEDVVLERDLDQEEERIKQTMAFSITSHSLEFYGICGKCSAV